MLQVKKQAICKFLVPLGSYKHPGSSRFLKTRKKRPVKAHVHVSEIRVSRLQVSQMQVSRIRALGIQIFNLKASRIQISRICTGKCVWNQVYYPAASSPNGLWQLLVFPAFMSALMLSPSGDPPQNHAVPAVRVGHPIPLLPVVP